MFTRSRVNKIVSNLEPNCYALLVVLFHNLYYTHVFICLLRIVQTNENM